MTSTVELYDKAIISRQPNFDERKTRSEFRKVIPNLKTVVVHCFDPRVTGGIPPAVAKALPARSTRERSSNSSAKTEKRNSVRTLRSFPSSLSAAAHPAARNDRSVSRAIFSTSTTSPSCITRIVAGRTSPRKDSWKPLRRSSGTTSRICGTPTILALKTSRSRYIATCEVCEILAGRQGT
jgi:hypothetical protein